MSTRIACPQGNVNGSHLLAHSLTAAQMERVIYALTGAYADALTETEGVFAGEASHEHLPCPLEVLGWAGDVELYHEYVDSNYEQARRPA